MAVYNTGAVRVRVGSSLVKGTTGNEQFSTYISSGYLFKLLGEPTWYQIAAITNATNFVLSSRYANSTYQTSRSEYCATGTTATKIYAGTLNYYPAIQEAVTITASGVETFTDDGGGVLVGNASGAGTINYDTSAWTITLGTNLTATVAIIASYLSGDTRTGMSYQIITDYTPIYDIPEMSLNDINFPHIYTKAIRIIDSKLSYIASYGSIGATTILNIQASLNDIYSDLTNVHASLNYLATHGNIRTIINHGTATLITIATNDLNKTHRFSNTASCYATFPTITSVQKGNFIRIRKKGLGIDFKCQGSNTIDDNATHIYNNNASQTNAFLLLGIETATNFEIETVFGDWGTY